MIGQVLLDVAVPYLRDWTTSSWAIHAGLLGGAVAFILFIQPILEGMEQDFDSDAPMVVVGVLAVAACIGFLGVPGKIMRHFPERSWSGWLMFGLLVLAVVMAGQALWANSRGYSSSRVGLVAYTPAGCLALGAVGGAVVDALNRAAASIPMSVASLVLLAVAAVIVVGLYVLSDR